MQKLTEAQFYQAYSAATVVANHWGEVIQEIQMNGDQVEIYGIENKKILPKIEKAFWAGAQIVNDTLLTSIDFIYQRMYLNDMLDAENVRIYLDNNDCINLTADGYKPIKWTISGKRIY